MECQPIDPPILAVRASVNDSPLAGKDGKYITLNALGERLDKEALTNPAIASWSKDIFSEISGANIAVKFTDLEPRK